MSVRNEGAALPKLRSADSAFEYIEQYYQYDSLGRLLSVVSSERPELNERYVYDASGNITEKTIGSDTVRMTYDKANQIVSLQDARGLRQFEYDSAGRMIRETLNGEPVASFTYGYLDKVTSVTRLRADSAAEGQARGGDETHFHYNASGMLVGKSKSHSTGSAGQRLELWQWDGLALVARGDNAYINEGHVSGASALMSRSLSEGDQRYLLTDYLGTTLAAFDAKGDRNKPAEVTAWNYTRTSFGAGSDSPEAMSRFTAKPYDADLGAHVFPYRNYRSDMGRWMSADPIGFPDGPNQHYYAPVPTMGVDPLGLEEVWLIRQVASPANGVYSTSTSYQGSGPDVTSSAHSAVSIQQDGVFAQFSAQFFTDTKVGLIPPYTENTAALNLQIQVHANSDGSIRWQVSDQGTSSINGNASIGIGWEFNKYGMNDNRLTIDIWYVGGADSYGLTGVGGGISWAQVGHSTPVKFHATYEFETYEN